MPTEGGIPPVPESMVERLIREAMERGEFEDLPGAGHPIEGLDLPYDPAWWARAWIRRERLIDMARDLRRESIAEARRLRASGDPEAADLLLADADRQVSRINRMLPATDRVVRPGSG